jgi:hypothetical protein
MFKISDMKNKILLPLSILATITIVLAACVKDVKETKAAAPPVVNNSWKEEFTNVGEIGRTGWVIVNNSNLPGLMSWRQGLYEPSNKFSLGGPEVLGFPAFSSEKSPNDFISIDMYSGSGASKLSAWLITPVTTIKNGDQFVFYTRASGAFGEDRLEVRANFTSSSANVGTTETSIGDFTKVLFDINPSFNGSYPLEWTNFTYTVAGVTGTISGRFAFRYFIPDGGPSGSFSDMLGVDAVSFISK